MPLDMFSAFVEYMDREQKAQRKAARSRGR